MRKVKSLALGLGRGKESGITLVEMLVVVALVAIVVAGAAISITTTMKSTDVTNVQNIALRQAQNVGFWVNRDVLAAKPGTIMSSSGNVLLSLTSYDWNGSSFVERNVSYVFAGDKLKRQVNGSSTQESLIAEYIDRAATSFKAGEGGKYTLTVKAVVKKGYGQASVERTYEVKPRLSP